MCGQEEHTFLGQQKQVLAEANRSLHFRTHRVGRRSIGTNLTAKSNMFPLCACWIVWKEAQTLNKGLHNILLSQQHPTPCVVKKHIYFLAHKNRFLERQMGVRIFDTNGVAQRDLDTNPTARLHNFALRMASFGLLGSKQKHQYEST